MALESFLADGAHEGEGLAAAATAVAARAVLLLLYLQHPKIMSSLYKLNWKEYFLSADFFPIFVN